jgi:Metal-dependent proteases with possible chaperone activity
MNYYLGIDTSNYTTSVAVCNANNIVVENIRIPLKVKDGERGLRQSDAVFAHVVNLPIAFEMLKKYEITAVGYSAYPRDVDGSYMPCFLAGECTARSIAALNDVPVYKFSHQAGHIASAVYSSGADEEALYSNGFIAFHVSGGTTEVLLMKSDRSITKTGGTLDLNAGQAIDRVGVKLGMKFPCGMELEREALKCNERIKVNVNVNGLNCNISGLENKADELIKNGKDMTYIALYTLEFIKTTLDKITENALEQYGGLPLLYAGGVMSNSIIKKYFTEKYNAYFAEPSFSADNAAGISILCRGMYINESE